MAYNNNENLLRSFGTPKKVRFNLHDWIRASRPPADVRRPIFIGSLGTRTSHPQC